MKNRLSLSSFALLVVAFLVYSTTGIFTKLASGEEFLSIEYLSFFAIAILTIGFYAILWQVVLKKVPLTQAFLFKSMTVLFSFCFAYFIFDESITWKNLLGATFIIGGIMVNSQNSTTA